MTEQNLLIIDPNSQQLSSMEVQLRSGGYEVATASTIERALKLLSVSRPDLIIADYQLSDDQTAADLCARLKGEIATREIPFIVLANNVEQRVESLTVGADEVLVRPIYIAELRDRVGLLLQRRKRLGLEQGVGQKFFGRLEEMGLLDLLQVIEVSKRSGKLMIEHQGTPGALWFDEGALHDGELGDMSGYEAVKRLLTWEFGQYEFDFKAEPRPDQVRRSLAEVRSEGLKHVDQWSKMCEQLPSLNTIFRSDPSAIEDRLESLNATQDELIRLFDGELTAMQVIDRAPKPDLDALREITQLYFEGLIYEVREVAPGSDPEPSFIDAVPSGVLPTSALNETPFPEPPLPDTPLPDTPLPDTPLPDTPPPEPLSSDLSEPPLPQITDFEVLSTPSGDLFDALTQLPPPVNAEEPPPMPEEYEDVASSDDLTDEGRDILAELYASPIDSLSDAPPPR